MEEKKLTGYPSIDKPWLKYYSEDAINAPLPECTIYEYLWENNKENFVSMFNLNYSQEQINTIFYAALSPNSRAAFVRHKYNITKEGPVNQKRKAESTYAGVEEHFSGLYFVGMVGINPITKQILYMVKIGQAQDIGDRMRQYLSMNPLIYHNNCSLPVRDFDDKNKWEKNCHKYMEHRLQTELLTTKNIPKMHNHQ